MKKLTLSALVVLCGTLASTAFAQGEPPQTPLPPQVAAITAQHRCFACHELQSPARLTMPGLQDDTTLAFWLKKEAHRCVPGNQETSGARRCITLPLSDARLLVGWLRGRPVARPPLVY